jgi:hypothetical protein
MEYATIYSIDSGDITMKVELSLDGKKIPMNKFVQKIIGSGIKGGRHARWRGPVEEAADHHRAGRVTAALFPADHL